MDIAWEETHVMEAKLRVISSEVISDASREKKKLSSDI